jgi:hypothetical protein
MGVPAGVASTGDNVRPRLAVIQADAVAGLPDCQNDERVTDYRNTRFFDGSNEEGFTPQGTEEHGGIPHLQILGLCVSLCPLW